MEGGTVEDGVYWQIGKTTTVGADSFTALAGWTTGSSNIKYNVMYKDGTITIKANDNIVAQVYDDTYKHGTIGFWGNNCEMSSYMYIKDIKINTKEISSIDKALKKLNWRKEAIRAVIDINDKESLELKKDSGMASVINDLLKDNVNYIGLGTNTNKEQMEKVISLNDDKGTFIQNSNYENAINQTAEYIKRLLEFEKKETVFVIADEEVEVETEPKEIISNTHDETYPFGKWTVNHGYDYYENNRGQYNKTDINTDEVMKNFKKTGKYVFTYAGLETNPSEIYSHRRPVALFDARIEGNNVILESKSYDLDLLSQNNGIQEEEWSYKKLYDTNWTNGKLTTMEQNTDYIVRLLVKDFQGAWSYPETKYITTKTDEKPIAQFNLQEDEITLFEDAQIVDTSYDPSLQELEIKEWKVYKEGTKIYSGEVPLINFRNYGTGEYIEELVVTNKNGLKSEIYSKTITVKDDEEAPEVIVNPVNSNWTNMQDVQITINDIGGSGVKNYKYAITDSQGSPENWSEQISKQEDIIHLNEDGIKYIHIIAEDNSGNISEDRIVGQFKIDTVKPVLNITKEEITEKARSQNIQITATDELSGIKEITVNGEKITENNLKITKNGKYTIEATDNAGNKETKEIEIEGIYEKKDAKLVIACPDKIYDGKEIVPIKELGENTSKIKYTYFKHGEETPLNYVPIDVGEYDVIGEQEEDENYTNTKSNKVTFNIVPKEIRISGLTAEDKKYDGTLEVKVSGGRVTGIIDGQEVNVIIPEKGQAEKLEPGTWKVKIDEIKIEGKDAKNYKVVQPEYGSITVTITQELLKQIPFAGNSKQIESAIGIGVLATIIAETAIFIEDRNKKTKWKSLKSNIERNM